MTTSLCYNHFDCGSGSFCALPDPCASVSPTTSAPTAVPTAVNEGISSGRRLLQSTNEIWTNEFYGLGGMGLSVEDSSPPPPPPQTASPTASPTVSPTASPTTSPTASPT
eukprot:CAMPEP_0118927284 /NCGR_PEP_ID=MMETSP1169-20130426/4786_1 /TAXON_ID=36882 /ORGANISM="Pyramimonas obovata, Strain CCMP722" /LENGTH=109 /DNA_ID=CAMNT_0006869021 /DNA_START=98 /DNA_END=423 /DNA_ORIENTATION=+